ncbi:MAG: ATP-binding protein, partial [Candidatus Poribacteria bacterium]
KLKRYVANLHGKPESDNDESVQKAFDEAALAMPAPSTLERLCKIFCLSSFERDVLLLCAGFELDDSFADLYANAQNDPQRIYPTFGLALAALPNAHWGAISPASSLRHWRMIEVEKGKMITKSPLRIDERILHYLAGLQNPDERLSGIIKPLQITDSLVPSHHALAERFIRIWSRVEDRALLPVIQLCGTESAGKHAIASAVCAKLGFNISLIFSHAIPSSPVEIDAIVQLWNRDAIIGNSVLLLNCEEADPADTVRENAIAQFIDNIEQPLIVACRVKRRITQRPTIILDVNKPTAIEQQSIWRSVLEAEKYNLNGDIDALVSQFNLSAPIIHTISTDVMARLEPMNEEQRLYESEKSFHEELNNLLWEACRTQVRPQLDDLAQRIETTATWEDLILPELQKQILQDIEVHVRQRMKVYETWGFASKCSRGLGISALFAGPSGTGKTLAAEVLANKLRLDLYRIDLSQVVSKYIGETEKNLRKVFDSAEEGGAILLFDEADAIFGKRSEVKDSHDRYANIEISYLLQRMEAYRGLAILTTNMKNALDTSFTRRIRFIVQFPFPDTIQRVDIWRHIFPKETQTEGLDWNKLARLNVTGGNIRN